MHGQLRVSRSTPANGTQRPCPPLLPQVAFYRVVSISSASSEVALHLLGFYAVASPHLLAWGPKDAKPLASPRGGSAAASAASEGPLLVVSTTNGELQVLRAPETLTHLKHASAQVRASELPRMAAGSVAGRSAALPT